MGLVNCELRKDSFARWGALFAIAMGSFSVLIPSVGHSLEQHRPKVLRAVIPGDSPPTYFKDKMTGKASGFAVDIMDLIAERAGVVVEYQFRGEWEAVIEAIKTGEADVSPGVGITEERRQVVDFAAPIDIIPVGVFVRADNTTIQSLKSGMTVGTIRRSAAYEYLQSFSGLTLVPYDSFSDGLFGLLAGRVDAFSCPIPTLTQLAREAGVEDKIRVIGSPLFELTRAAAVKKGNTQLLDLLNKAQAGLIESAQYRKIYVKWYGSATPYWTLQHVLIAIGSVSLLVLIGMALWRHISIVRLNRALIEAEAKFRTLFDKSGDAIFILNLGGTILDMNEVACERYGYSKSELVGRGVAQIDAPEETSKIPQRLATIQSERRTVFNALHITKDGKRIPSEVNARVVHLGRMAINISSCRDITERKRAEQERDQLLTKERAARIEAQDAIRVRDDFLAIASHELRTPLTPLFTYVQLVKRHLSQIEPSVVAGMGGLLKALDNTDKELRRLAKLIEDLLDVSRITSGHLVLNRERVDLPLLLREVNERLAPDFQRAQCTLETSIQPDVHGFWDRSRIEQMVSNLLTNALKYGAGKPIEVRLVTTDSRATLSVRDHGIGIAPEEHANLFQRFGRIASIRQFPGLGMGLYIVRQVVEAHGGTIRVESELGQGAKFIVDLPLRQATPDSLTSSTG